MLPIVNFQEFQSSNDLVLQYYPLPSLSGHFRLGFPKPGSISCPGFSVINRGTFYCRDQTRIKAFAIHAEILA